MRPRPPAPTRSSAPAPHRVGFLPVVVAVDLIDYRAGDLAKHAGAAAFSSARAQLACGPVGGCRPESAAAAALSRVCDTLSRALFSARPRRRRWGTQLAGRMRAALPARYRAALIGR